jgi:biopolymer transport protein ExbB/TolQ
MNDILAHLLEYIAGAAIVGLIVWVWVLWLSHMNAGSPAMWIAVWISTICCAIVVTMTWNWREDQTKQMISSQEQARKLDNANDKLSIILQWAPKLAKEVDDEMKQKEIDHAHDKP